jgi:hypothetical protein
MKTKRMKKGKSNGVNQVEVDFYDKNLIYDEFKKIIEYIIEVELEEELHNFPPDFISRELIDDFIEFSKELYENEFRK